ncbi:Glycosyl hydrolase [Pseudomonas sp. 8Z]|uniref:WD40/YVTN/BNR-like repeat-containing protein n=1 Tax=Pseudomonas sp. 8Z TaxID=2653166 RepID=UPI0012F1AB4E|nr:YCF48-related protein [Pseudomonas sp. 8Z]VXC51399.1 Glycosyl hydrolase [Pseudomonas sp. 8Z]
MKVLAKGLSGLALVLAGVFALGVQAAPAVLERPALLSAKAERSVILDLARAGQRLVAVGERGIILLSDDNGASWRQVEVPVSVNLTAVQFVDAQQGWAVGHLGVVLHSSDGGETWSKQLDGIQAANLVLQAAQASGDSAQIQQAEAMVADGPDKPFLDLYFQDARVGYLVGAYNLILRTEDGGQTWQSWMEHLDNPQALNLYAIRAWRGDLYIAGERGLLLRSSDGGEHFAALTSPYEGSFFGLLATHDGLLAFGLRGNAWWSSDGGESWQGLETGVESALAAALELADGRLLLAGQGGELLIAQPGSLSTQSVPLRLAPGLSSVVQAADGSLASGGLSGIAARQIPEQSAQR